MENLKGQISSLVSTLFQYFVNVLNFYISIAFFLVLLVQEAIYGKVNLPLKNKMIELVDKIIELPLTVNEAFSKENLSKRFNFNNIF